MPEFDGEPIDQEELRLSMANPGPFTCATALIPVSPPGSPTKGPDARSLSFMTNAFHRMRAADSRHSQVITSLMFFEGPVDINVARTLLSTRMAPFQRFRSIITSEEEEEEEEEKRGMRPPQKSALPSGATSGQQGSKSYPSPSLSWLHRGPLSWLRRRSGRRRQFFWKEVQVDLTYHVIEDDLPEPQDESAVYDFMGRSFGMELDPRRPQWRFHIFNRYGGPQGRCAIVTRISHEIGDGPTLIQVVLSMFENLPQPELNAATPVQVSSPGVIPGSTFAELTQSPKKENGPGATKVTPAKAATATTKPSLLSRLQSWLCRHATLTALVDPPLLLLLLLRLPLLYVTSVARGLTHAVLPADTATCLKLRSSAQVHTERRVGFSQNVPLGVIQQIRPVVGGTVNDVLAAAVAGTLRRYLQLRQDEALLRGPVQIRAVIPFNLRRRNTWDLVKNPQLFGNKFTLLPLTLPVAAAHPHTLLREAKQLCDELKDGLEATALIGLNRLASAVLPTAQYLWLTHVVLSKMTLLFTNVVGPRRPVAFAGVRLVDLGFFVPSPFGVCVSVLSYNGLVKVGVLTDPGLPDCDPKAICDCFEQEIEVLKSYAEAYARTPKDPRSPARYQTLPRRAVAQLLSVLAAALLALPRAWALPVHLRGVLTLKVPLSYLLYAYVVACLWRQHPPAYVE